ncbi:MAG TPA: putative Ig domain-containing protein [Bryobacteraceae bacterium]|nr:putative Ig domain-containing protein [Bryobacteraceae bacterium]
MRTPCLIAGLVVTVSCALVAQAQVSIATNSLPFGGVNQSYTGQVTATGGSGNYIFGLQSGNLPPGLNLSQQGIISGAPTVAGTYSFVVRVLDTQTQQTATKNLSIGVMQISTPSPLPSAVLGTAYSVTFAVSDGPAPPFNWSTNPSALPPGVTLNASTGTLSGTPTSLGTYNFDVTAFKDATNTRATKSFTLVVSNAALTLTINNASPLPSTEVGLTYPQQTITASGGQPPYSFFSQPDPFTPSGLPPGITLGQDGTLGGVATMDGVFNFTIFVQDSNANRGSKKFTITVATQLILATQSPLPDGTMGVAYSQVISASGGVPPYTFFIANPPPGLSLDKNGSLTGTPTTTGTFTFTVSVADNMGGAVTKNYQVTFGSTAPPPAVPVKTTPTSLAFTAPYLGNSPPPQFIDVTPGGTLPASFKVQLDNGPNTAAPNWITVQPVGGLAPMRVIVRVDQGSMAPGKYTARILIIDATPNFTTVSVTLLIVDTPARFDIVPSFLRFTARVVAPGIQEQILTVRNGGGGNPFTFSVAAVPTDVNFVTSVTPNVGALSRNTSVAVHVRINTTGMAVGSYRVVIRFTTPFGVFDAPVTVFVAADGAILGVNVTGVRLQALQGGGFSNPAIVKVLNVGNPATTLTWTAELVSGSDLFTFSVSGKTASFANPGTISIVPTPAALLKPPNGYFGLLKITGQALNSPQYVVLLLDLASSTSLPLPDLFPTGFLFIVTPGVQTPAQIMAVNTTSLDPVPFEVAVTTADGGSWLVASPTSGTTSSKTPGQTTFSVSFPAGQAAGIYSGEGSVSVSGTNSTATVTAIVLPSASTAASDAAPAATCIASKLAITTNGLVNNFGVPAKWPETLIVQLNDDCGVPVLNGAVSASFSNGDAPLSLRGDGQAGTYSASWQPVQDATQMVVTLQASAGILQPATLQLMGAITPNSGPVLSVNGTVNPFNRVGGGALAPGTLVEVYGSGLASSVVSPNVLPLPPVFNGSFVTVGPYQAPFTFLSPGQVNVQLPAELVPTQQFPILVSANNAFTMPDTLDIVPIKPAVAGFADTHIIAQHAADFTLVDATHPAKPGEFVVMYLLGMGPTAPLVATGVATPLAPLATVVTQPLVMVGGRIANVAFAGLTPGLAGLYQVDFQVPVGTPPGDADVVVSQGTVFANTTKLPVGN